MATIRGSLRRLLLPRQWCSRSAHPIDGRTPISQIHFQTFRWSPCWTLVRKSLPELAVRVKTKEAFSETTKYSSNRMELKVFVSGYCSNKPLITLSRSIFVFLSDVAINFFAATFMSARSETCLSDSTTTCLMSFTVFRSIGKDSMEAFAGVFIASNISSATRFPSGERKKSFIWSTPVNPSSICSSTSVIPSLMYPLRNSSWNSHIHFQNVKPVSLQKMEGRRYTENG